MGDTLFGKERSGTPMETRGATGSLGSLLQAFLRSEGASGGGYKGGLPFQRLRSDAFADLMGSMGGYGVDEALLASLRDPADQTAGLFAAMRPFEERAMSEGLADVNETFGTMGARFSPNILKARGDYASNLNETFAKSREQALLTAGSQRDQALANILGLGLGAQGQRSNDINALLSFLQGGAPYFQQGMMGDLLGAGINLAGLKYIK